mmetsp:Transcript_111928/g.311599  ORF Transcript_111928/g.311599 Transcript_111928/m.311599 type:complete len:288 (+) Transcript_111928:2487-3350(+)
MRSRFSSSIDILSELVRCSTARSYASSKSGLPPSCLLSCSTNVPMRSATRPVPWQTTTGHLVSMNSSTNFKEIIPPFTRIMTRGAWVPRGASTEVGDLAGMQQALAVPRREAKYASRPVRKETSEPKALLPATPLSQSMEWVWFSWIFTALPSAWSWGQPSASAASTFFLSSPPEASSLRQDSLRPPKGVMPMQGTRRCLSCSFMAFPTMSMTPLFVPPVVTQAPVRKAACTRPLEKLSMSNFSRSMLNSPAPPMIERMSFGSAKPHSCSITRSQSRCGSARSDTTQ